MKMIVRAEDNIRQLAEAQKVTETKLPGLTGEGTEPLDSPIRLKSQFRQPRMIVRPAA